ncbi:hypothetical protein PSSY5922_23260 [Pseudomonas synxantha]
MGVQGLEVQAVGGAALQHFRDRIVFEDQDSVEQCLATATGPTLDLVKRCVFVFAQAQVQRLYALQPTAEALLGLRGRHHRQGVDEQANLLLDPGQMRRAPRYRGTKRHRGLSAVALQQQQPGGLYQSVERDFLLTGKFMQPPGLRGVHHAIVFAIGRPRQGRYLRLGQAGRLFQGQ